MSRICRFYHAIPRDEEQCAEGHYLCATLDCQVKGCKYITRPHSMSNLKHAIEMMKLHMAGAHPHLQDILAAANKEAHSETDSSSNKKQQDDPSSDITCPKCFKLFFNKKNVKRHMKTQHSGLQRYSCSDCDKTFASNTSVNYHKKKSHPRPPGIKCDNCEETFDNFEAFKMHSRKHTSASSHKCDDCHDTFSSRTNLNRHALEEHKIVNMNVKKTSFKDYPFTCDECDFFTKRKHYMQQHKLKIHGADQQMSSCHYCQETFKYKSNLMRHNRRFHESEMIISDILNTIFENVGTLI